MSRAHTNTVGCSLFNVPLPHLKSNKHIEKLTRYSKFCTGVPAGPPILVSVPVFQDDCRPTLFHLHSLSIVWHVLNLVLKLNILMTVVKFVQPMINSISKAVQNIFPYLQSNLRPAHMQSGDKVKPAIRNTAFV